jgi:hypothetical protein
MVVEAKNPDGSPTVRSGPYLGNGATVAFDYDFPITRDTEVKVMRQNADLTETVLTPTTQYTVSGVGAASGGQVTLTSGALLPTGSKLILLLNMDFEQPVDYSNQGRIQLSLLETSLDRLTLVARQLREELSRAVTVDTFSTTDLGTFRANITALGLIEAQIASVAANIAPVTAVSGGLANINAVAGIAAAVSSVASIAANVSTVASNMGAITTNAANITAILGAAGAATAAASSASDAAASAAAAQLFNPAAYVSRSNFISDAGNSIALSTEVLSEAQSDLLLPTLATAARLVRGGSRGIWAQRNFAQVVITDDEETYGFSGINGGVSIAPTTPSLLSPFGSVLRSGGSQANSGGQVVGKNFPFDRRGLKRTVFVLRVDTVTSIAIRAGFFTTGGVGAVPDTGFFFVLGDNQLRTVAALPAGASTIGPPVTIAAGDLLHLEVEYDFPGSTARFRAYRLDPNPVLLIDEALSRGTWPGNTLVSSQLVALRTVISAGDLLTLYTAGFGVIL